MKTFSYFLAVALMVMGASAYAAGKRPFCADVNVQIDQDNKSEVQQNCDRNVSRTAQAGQNNSAMTEQNGRINDNTVRQHEFSAAPRAQRPKH